MSESPTRVVYTSQRGLTYQQRGEGPPLVLVHGWCLDRGMWMYQEEALADSFTVVAPDLAGFGESATLAGPYEVKRHTHDLADLIEKLDAGAVTMVGFAYGAMVAMELATSFPGVVDRLVLIGVPSAATAPYDRMPRAMRRDWPEFAARSARGISAENTSEATLAWLTQMFARTPLPVALRAVHELGSWEPLPIAGKITAPTLLVHGTKDRIVPPEISEATAEAMPNATVERIEGAAHLAPVDANDKLNHLITGFARSAS